MELKTKVFIEIVFREKKMIETKNYEKYGAD